MMKYGLLGCLVGAAMGTLVIVISCSFAGVNVLNLISPAHTPLLPPTKHYFNSFHVLNGDALTETYIHVEADSVFDAQMYCIGRLIDSTSGVINDHNVRNKSGIIIGWYANDSISITINRTIVICKKK